MALTKDQLDAINEGDAQRAHDSKLRQLRSERDQAREYLEQERQNANRWACSTGEAGRHLRQLLHALDSQCAEEGDAYISHNVGMAMVEARRYLQGETTGREKE